MTTTQFCSNNVCIEKSYNVIIIHLDYPKTYLGICIVTIIISSYRNQSSPCWLQCLDTTLCEWRNLVRRVFLIFNENNWSTEFLYHVVLICVKIVRPSNIIFISTKKTLSFSTCCKSFFSLVWDAVESCAHAFLPK